MCDRLATVAEFPGWWGASEGDVGGGCQCVPIACAYLPVSTPDTSGRKSRQLPEYLVRNVSSMLPVVNPAARGYAIVLTKDPDAVTLLELFVKDTERKIVPCMRVVIPSLRE